MTDKVMWEGNGYGFTIKSDNVPVLETPFAVLADSPDTIVGKDPATDMPAFCPPTPQPASAPVKTPPATGGTCVDTRCGAALACTQRLQDQYENWQKWINAAIAAIGTASITALLNWLSAFLVGLEATGAIANTVLNVFKGIRPALSLVSGTVLGGVLPAWDSTTVDNVQRVFFAALQCTGSNVSITQGDLNNVAGYIRANTASFLGNIVSELLALICDYSTLSDWQVAVNGSAPSTLCAGY